MLWLARRISHLSTSGIDAAAYRKKKRKKKKKNSGGSKAAASVENRSYRKWRSEKWRINEKQSSGETVNNGSGKMAYGGESNGASSAGNMA